MQPKPEEASASEESRDSLTHTNTHTAGAYEQLTFTTIADWTTTDAKFNTMFEDSPKEGRRTDDIVMLVVDNGAQWH